MDKDEMIAIMATSIYAARIGKSDKQADYATRYNLYKEATDEAEELWQFIVHKK